MGGYPRPVRFLLDPIAVQRLEGGMLLALSLLLYWKQSGSWLLYLVLAAGGLAEKEAVEGTTRGKRRVPLRRCREIATIR